MGILLLSSSSTPGSPAGPLPLDLAWDKGDYLYLYARKPSGKLVLVRIETADLSQYLEHVFEDEPLELIGSQLPLISGSQLIVPVDHGDGTLAIQKLCNFTELAEET